MNLIKDEIFGVEVLPFACDITNIKNPRSGKILVRGKIGSVTIDGNILPPADCEIREI